MVSFRVWLALYGNFCEFLSGSPSLPPVLPCASNLSTWSTIGLVPFPSPTGLMSGCSKAHRFPSRCALCFYKRRILFFPSFPYSTLFDGTHFPPLPNSLSSSLDLIAPRLVAAFIRSSLQRGMSPQCFAGGWVSYSSFPLGKLRTSPPPEFPLPEHTSLYPRFINPIQI